MKISYLKSKEGHGRINREVVGLNDAQLHRKGRKGSSTSGRGINFKKWPSGNGKRKGRKADGRIIKGVCIKVVL
jgi:hypothetical protein